MSNIREVISLQFGHYSNYVGAHFWNIEELGFDYTGDKKTDVSHDVLYREGVTSDGKVTYTPRLLLTDLKNSLKSLPLHGGLEDQNEEVVTEWHQTETINEGIFEENEYQKSISNNLTQPLSKIDLSSSVITWTDYLYPRFHNRTINIINQYKHQDKDVPFETFNEGCNIWKNEQFSEEFCDNIRRYSEECDSFQGFNILLDATDGFGGLASKCLEYLNDQYSNKSILAIPIIASHFPDRNFQTQKDRELSHQKDLIRLVNLALTYEQLFEYSSLFVPVSCRDGWKNSSSPRMFYNVNYNVENYYETSAILASALNTISLKYRSKNSQLHLSDLCSDMSGYGRKMAAMSLGLPFHMSEKDYLIDHLNNLKSSIWTCLTPSCNIANDKVFQHVVVRGIPEVKLKKTILTANEQLKLAAYKCNSVKEMFEFYFQCNCFLSASNVNVSELGMEIKTPFPNFFSKDLNMNGFVKEFEDPSVASQVPIIAGIHNGNFLFDKLECLHREVKRIRQSKLQKFFSEGFDQEDFTHALENLNERLSHYQDDFEL